MASNLKGGNPIVRLLLAHGEKLGMAAIAVCVLLLLWSALGVERLESDKHPERLQQAASSAEDHVRRFRWNDIDENNKLIARAIPGEMMQPVKEDHFPVMPYPWERPVIEPVGPRTDPILLAPDALEVHGDSGLWASADPEVIKQHMLDAVAEEQRLQQEELRDRSRERDRGMEGLRGDTGRDGGRGGPGRGLDGGIGRDEPRRRGQIGPIVERPMMGAQLQGGFEQIKAESWITVLARVPVKDQYRQYEDTLQTARGYRPNLDVPEYIGYEIQRAEITADGLGDWELVASVGRRGIMKEIAEYPMNPPEVVSPRYTHPILTHPLPPLILKEWDQRASHSTMPLAVDEMPEDEEELVDDPLLAEAVDEDDPFGARRRDTQLGRAGAGMREDFRGEYGGATRRGGYDMDGGYGGRGRMGGEIASEGGMRGRGMGGYGGRLGAGSGVELPEFVWDHRTSHVLLRYFDTRAEPGSRYRYQVRLVLRDVNRGVPESHLDPSVNERIASAQVPHLVTEWSDPSPIASVPLPARLFLASSDPAREGHPTSEPRATVLIKALNAQYAAELAREETVTRGSVINFRDKPTVIWSNQYDPDEDPEFNFHTNLTLLDVQGGEKMARMTSPARAIVMDGAGRLFIQDELKDSTPVRQFKEVVEFGGEGGDRMRGRGFGGYGLDRD